jgi:hypothetical protein
MLQLGSSQSTEPVLHVLLRCTYKTVDVQALYSNS